MNRDNTQLRVFDFIEAHAQEQPEKTALIFGDERISYLELWQRVRTWAKSLIAAGIQPGERVAFLGASRPEFVVNYLAAGTIGAIWQGLNPDYRERELAYVLADASPERVFAFAPEGAEAALERVNGAAATAGVNPPIAANTPEWDAFERQAETISDGDLAERMQAVQAQDPAMVVYTSGSTGAPKGALIRHAGIVRLGMVQSGKWDLESPVVLCNLPINHIGCVGDLCSVPLIAGGTVVLRERFDAKQVIEDIEQHQISALFGVATQLQRVASLPEFDSRPLQSLKTVGWGGSPLPLATMQKYRHKGCRLMSTYGLTEATFSVTYTDLDASDEVLLNTVGKPDPDIQLRILGENGEWLDAGDEGEVCIKHDATMVGYLNRPEATAAAYTPDGWLRTGDIGQVRKDGNLVLIGRVSEMYKSGGYNVYPREIEQLLEEHPDVALVAVVPRPDPDFQEVGVAFVQPKPNVQIDTTELKAWLGQRLAGYKVPKNFVINESIPLLPVGKVNKPSLKEIAKEMVKES